MNDIEVDTVLQTENMEENTDSYKKTLSKLNVVSFTYEDKKSYHWFNNFI
jgi:hypothetical protein